MDGMDGREGIYKVIKMKIAVYNIKLANKKLTINRP